ncbi:MAG: CusA/CzcA family heavy metal efflux RND transporter [Phycisphaerae bacterium]|nr:CusA/CzcA family heavy metal efflux RND transporter [Phycisphaerae bacterium]
MLERILQFSIQHRYLIVLLTLGAAACGVYSLVHLPIDAVPDITNNQVQINTVYPALSTVEIEKQVTFPIETALAGIPGLQSTRSLSRNGFSQVTAIFEDDVNIYFARQQVNERLLEARESLPPGAEPKMGAISTGLGEVYMWTVEYEHPDGQGATITDGQPGWQSDGSYLTPEGERLTTRLEKAAYLRTVQDWIIRPQLKGVKDVAGVDAIGGYVKQYHVQPDPMKLVAYGLTFSDVIGSLERNNLSVGAGYIEHKGEAYLVRAAGRIRNETEIGNIVLGVRDGTPIYVRHVAEVRVGKELPSGSASENGHEVVVGTAFMLIGANSRTVSVGVDEKLREINKSLPPDIRAKTVLNRTKLVDATIRTVALNLTEGAILVIVILFVMLGNIRAALITALAIPLSMLLTAIGMVQSRVSGNLMSLGAIDFGLIVDGAVIIVENCLRMLGEKQHELGRKLTLAERLEVVFVASKQVRSATAFGEAIIITVYFPILALTGIEGRMFHPMAMTVIFALTAAFVLSLTFVPAMVAAGITGRVQEKENILVRAAKWAYEPTVRAAIHHRKAVVLTSVGAFAASLLLFLTLGQEFVPTLDEKDIAMHAVRIPSTSLTQSSDMQFEVEKVVSQFPEVAFVYSKTGTAEMAADPMPPNVSDTFIILKPQTEWPNPSEPKLRLIQRIEDAVRKLPGNNYEFTQPIQMRFNELLAGVRGDVAVKVFGDEVEHMEPAAQKIAGILRGVIGSADVKVEQTKGLPVMNVEIDRAAIARYGLNVADVQDVVAIAVGGREAGLVFQGDRRFNLIVRLPEHVRADIETIRNLPIPLLRGEEAASIVRVASVGNGNPKALRGGFIPLGAVARIDIAEGPNQISRENGKRRVVVQCNVRGRDIGSFVTEAQRKIDEQVKLAAGTWLSWGGQFENLIAARRRLMIVVPICFFFIFILLFSTFNSVKYAALVFTGVPLALTGGIVSLWLRDMPFSISAAVGFIALSGVAVLNGLVMITFINQLRAEGQGLEEAVIHGSMTRLRPVLMTALVAALGFVPMALATSTGAEVQRPLATVVVGGIISSTFLTLVVLPGLYRIWHRAI